MKNLKLIYKIAWSFHHTTGIDVKDLIQEASIAYFEALKTYNPEISKLSTYTWRCVSSHLKNYIKRELKQLTADIEECVDYLMDEPVPLWQNLTPDGAHICSLIKEYESVLTAMNQVQSKNYIREKLSKQGWPSERINHSYHEIEAALQ